MAVWNLARIQGDFATILSGGYLGRLLRCENFCRVHKITSQAQFQRVLLVPGILLHIPSLVDR